MFKKEVLLVFTIIFIASSYGARILTCMPAPSYSHQIVFQPLWRELSLKGHQVVSLTTDPMNDASLTNLTEIDLSFSHKYFKECVQKMVESNQSFFQLAKNIFAELQDMSNEQLQHNSVQKLIKNQEERFDLLIVEGTVATAAFAFAHRFKCPYIVISSFDASSFILRSFGNPTNTAIYPENILPFDNNLTFLQRMINSIVYVFTNLVFRYYLMPFQDQLVVKHFGTGYPSLSELMANASMAFVNGDSVLHQVKPLVPAIIQIGIGTHIKNTTTPLPKELQKELDDATQGFIYFSLGSNVRSKDLGNKTINVIFETFSEIPYKIIWKYEIDELPNKPNNIITYRWLPQQQVLKHPNIKLFITQGGLQSLEEAIYNYVPMVGMPFFGDQGFNVQKIVSKGLGLSVDWSTLDKQEFKSKILEVINSPKYRNNIKELADLAQDQPMTGLERAIWWTEYVIRHKGARHLRSPALDMPWYQYFLLDVIVALLVVFLIIIYLVILLGKLLFNLFKFLFRRERKLKKH